MTQTFMRVGPSFSATAAGNGGFQQYTEELPPRGAGWEYIESLDMPGHAAEWAQIAVEKLSREVGGSGALRPHHQADRICGSRSTNRSAIRRSWIGRWATRRTSPARVSLRRRRR